LITVTLAVSIATYPLLYIQAATLQAGLPSASEFAPPAQGGLSAEQLDNLFAPIALYPDPLLAQMLPASTFVDQVDQSARYLRANNNQPTGVDNQSWDVSVKSIAHYPQVVYAMSDKLDWTTAIGQAYVSQAVDVFGSIQRLRGKAKKAGYLVTSPQQTVIVEKEVIKIVPAQPQYIYVPTYNPQVVYVQPASTGASTGSVVATAAIAFTAGLLIGAWLNNDCNWYSHSVYYHGWHGTGWVSHSATVVHVNGNYYVNSRYSTVHYNTAVVNRNVNYNNVNTYNNVSRNVNYNNVNVNNVNVNNVNKNNVNVNNANVNNVNKNTVNNSNMNKNNVNNANANAYKGQARTQTGTNKTASQQRSTAWGGGGNSAQTQAQSQRGQASRSSAQSTPRSRPTSSGGGGGRRKN
jgi:hypothetical protein